MPIVQSCTRKCDLRVAGAAPRSVRAARKAGLARHIEVLDLFGRRDDDQIA